MTPATPPCIENHLQTSEINFRQTQLLIVWRHYTREEGNPIKMKKINSNKKLKKNNKIPNYAEYVLF